MVIRRAAILDLRMLVPPGLSIQYDPTMPDGSTRMAAQEQWAHDAEQVEKRSSEEVSSR